MQGIVPRVLVALLAGISLTGGAAAQAPGAGDPFLWYGSLDRAFTLLDEPAAAVDAYRPLAPGEDPAVLDAALAKVFPETPPKPDEASAIRILSYVSQVVQLKFTATPSGSQVLEQGFGYCNGMGLAFVALCRRIGLPARMNGLHNFEWMQAHNMTEVHYEGTWHMLDPTYGAFFYTRPEYDGEGRVPSLRELFAHTLEETYCIQVTDSLWTGNFDPGQTIQPASEDRRLGSRQFTLPEFYDHLFGRAFPVVPSDEAAVSNPIDLDLRERDELWIGKRDGDLMDMFGRRPDASYARYHGVPYIGKTRLGGAYHTLTIKVAKPGRYRLTYHLGPGGNHEKIDTVELKNVIVGGKSWTKDTWSAEFYVQDTEALLLIANRYYAAYIDAMHIVRLPEPAGQQAGAAALQD